jgi:hypothetical protein
MQFYDNFIGYEPHLCNEIFSGFDSEELFKQSLITKDNDWYYRTHPISYIRNSTGHRSKELSDVDLNNYILFTGCSLTEGIGLELEKTYSYITSKNLNCDYYNLGLAGTGSDVVTYNLVQWHNIVKTSPKAVVIQWPWSGRYSVINKDKGMDHLTTIGPWSAKNSPEISRFLTYGELSTVSYFTSKKAIAQRLIKSLFNCPVIEIDMDTFDKYGIDFDKMSRDGVHPGIDFHTSTARITENKINNAIQQ